jgi:putative membrane protein
MTRYKWFLLALFVVAWLWAAYEPKYYDGWILENYLVFIFVPIILIAGYYFRLSNVSYTLITIFMILHVIGSHYTYAEVPFGYTLQNWLGAERNMYDRLVHFSFGFLLAYPIREIFMRLSRVKGVWSYYFPIDLAGAFSAIYEIIEWIAARNVDPAAGLAFLGSQGDIWDAQKDMLLAILGSVIAMLIVFIINAIFNKNHWKELFESLKIPKGDRPLGEEKLKEYLTSKTN